MTISNADQSVYLPPLVDHRKFEKSVAHNVDHYIYHHLCKSLSPSVYPIVNVALRAIPICNMYHDVDLVEMVVLTLNFILWLKVVVFYKIHN